MVRLPFIVVLHLLILIRAFISSINGDDLGILEEIKILTNEAIGGGKKDYELEIEMLEILVRCAYGWIEERYHHS